MPVIRKEKLCGMTLAAANNVKFATPVPPEGVMLAVVAEAVTPPGNGPRLSETVEVNDVDADSATVKLVPAVSPGRSVRGVKELVLGIVESVKPDSTDR